MDYINGTVNLLDPIYIPEMDQGNVIIRNETYLTTLTVTMSTIGITLSASAVFIMLLTAILFEEWRRIYKNQLLMQFMISKFVFTVTRYFIDINITFNLYEVNQLHLYVLVFLTLYTEAALVSWMFVFTKQMYNSLVKVFNVHEHNLWKVSTLAWLLPLLPATMLYISVLMDYMKLQIYGVYVFLIKWPVLFANAYLLIQVIRSVLSTNKSNPQSNRRIIIVMIVLIFNFCIQQLFIDTFKIFLVTYINNRSDFPFVTSVIVVVYNISSLYHCAFTIFFWLFGNQQTRRLWKFESNTRSPLGFGNPVKPGMSRPMSVPNPVRRTNPVFKKQFSVV
uniref:G-protein coupled receptors family 2 profile 2 domain-containing protein n=1 Tax=Pectinophora gossypiella TaxID=13191 RepID=A0A1E1WPH1_PECGO